MTIPRALPLLASLLLLLPIAARAGDPPAAPPGATNGRAEDSRYGSTYTPKELEALDRILHAANMTREDLRFKKDKTKGTDALPIALEMLRDPLEIAAATDRIADALWKADPGRTPGPGLVAVSATLTTEAATSPSADLGGGRAAASPKRGLPEGAEPTPAAVLDVLEKDLACEAPKQDLEDEALRRELPGAMDWHDVFPSPYPKDVNGKIDAFLKDKGPAWVHEEASKIDLGDLATAWTARFAGLPAWLSSLPKSAFPADHPLVRDTPYGRIALGTPKDDVYEGDYALLVDPGGNDRYVRGRLGAADAGLGRPFGFFLDLGGDDVYECGDVDGTLGSAILGLAAFYDLGQGNDRYEGGHASLGAAMGGIALFYDDGGSDVYEGKTFTEGAAGFGFGIFDDDAKEAAPVMTTDEGTKDPVDFHLFDNDRLEAWANAQAFARCRGIALCMNRRGNDVYEAGGVYLDAPLFADRYQSFSQGFAIGEREIDYAGGIALLLDGAGNDRYLGDIYDQGVGYWYGAGLLWEGGGNDTYEMTQYGQGSGIHLAVGGLVDVVGNDSYVMHSGLGQGGSHDYAAGILQDRGGSDHYFGNSSCCGTGLTNSVGILIDRAGDDTYAARRDGGVNFGRPARDFSSIGLFIDLGGKDDYLGIMKDGELWRQSDIGVGIDLDTAGAVKSPNAGGGPNRIAGKAEIPPVCSYEGELKQKVFDELWDLACRWEVGDNRLIVPEARKRLARFGVAVLPYLDAEVEHDRSGLELRAFVSVLKGVEEGDADAGPKIEAFLRENLAAETPRRERVALYLIAELGVTSMAPDVAKRLGDADDRVARSAAGVLGKLGSRDGDAVLRTWLAPGRGEERIQAALGVLVPAGTAPPEAVAELLAHPLLSVRTMLVNLLSKHLALYREALSAALASGKLPPRAARSLLDAWTRSDEKPDPAFALVVSTLLDHPDWGMRADAARLIRHWESMPDAPADAVAPAVAALEERLLHEEDPYVRFAAKAPRD